MGCMMMMGCGGGMSAAFSPADISGLQLWLDATRGLYQERTGASATTPAASDGDPVGTWLDYSGNARHVTAASDAVRPTLKLAIQNAEQVVRCDGSNDRLDSGAFTLSQPCTLLVAFSRISGPGGNRGVLDQSGGGYARAVYTDTPTERVNLYAGAILYGDACANGAFGIWTCVFNGASSSIQLNEAAADTGNAGASAASGVRVGATSDADALNCDVAEVLAYSGTLSAGDLTSLREYLNDKWAIY